jgi:hypothetical protein
MILGLEIPGIPLDEEDVQRVNFQINEYARIRKALQKAERLVIEGGMDMLMMLDGCSLAKARMDIEQITIELEKNRTEIEPALMADLQRKYGPGYLDHRNMKWITTNGNNL